MTKRVRHTTVVPPERRISGPPSLDSAGAHHVVAGVDIALS